MANAVFGYNNLIESGTLVAGSEAAGLTVSQLKVPQGSTATSWQTATGVKTAAAGAWFTVDAGSETTWQAFLLARTSLTPSAEIRWRVGDPNGWTEIAPSYEIDFTASPSMTGWSTTRSGGGGTGEATYFDSSGNLAVATGTQFRFTNSPETLESLGLLWEPARTNYCRNPRMLNAVTKSQGVLPTNWAVGSALSASLPAGIEYIVSGGGTEGGFAYVDIRFFGTPTDANPVVRIKPEINADGVTPTIVASVGQAWTFNFRVRGSSSWQNEQTPPCEAGIDEYNGSTFLTGSSTPLAAYGVSTGTFTGSVRTHSRTLTNASTTRIVPYVQYQLTQNVPCDFFVRFGDPQALRSAVNYITNPAGVTGRTNGSIGTNATRTGWADVTRGFNPLLVATGTEDGIPYVDYRVIGTVPLGFAGTFYGETGNTATPTVLGDPWTFSIFSKNAAATLYTVPTREVVLMELNSGGTTLGYQRTTIQNSPENTARLASSRASANFYVANVGGTTAIVRGGIAYTFPAGQIDVTIRVGIPQLENGASATFPILQSGTSTTSTPARLTDASNRTITALTNYTVAVEGIVNGSPTAVPANAPLGNVSVYAAGSTNGGKVGPTFVSTSGQINAHGDWWNPSATFGAFNGGGIVLAGQVFRAAIGYTAASQGAGCNGVISSFTSAPGTHTATLDRLAMNTAAAGSIIYRRLRLFSSRLTDGRIYSGLAADGTTLDLSSVTYDSGWAAAGVQPGYGQTFRFSDEPAIGRYLFCEINDDANPDNFIAVGLAFAGPVWQPALNIGWETTTNTDARVDEVVTRGGQEYPQYRFEQRRWDVSMQHILDSEIWGQAVEVQRAGRQGGNILFVPDPSGEHVQKEAVFGRVYSQSDIEYSNNTTQYRSWRLRAVERL